MLGIRFKKKKEKLEGVFIKYSHETAEVRPHMIKREYELEIRKIEKEIRSYEDKLKYVEFNVTFNSRNEEKNIYKIIYESSYDNFRTVGKIRIFSNEMKIEVKPETLQKMIVDNAEVEYQLNNLRKTKKNIEKEHNKFIKKYI